MRFQECLRGLQEIWSLRSSESVHTNIVASFNHFCIAQSHCIHSSFWEHSSYCWSKTCRPFRSPVVPMLTSVCKTSPGSQRLHQLKMWRASISGDQLGFILHRHDCCCPETLRSIESQQEVRMGRRSHGHFFSEWQICNPGGKHLTTSVLRDIVWHHAYNSSSLRVWEAFFLPHCLRKGPVSNVHIHQRTAR